MRLLNCSSGRRRRRVSRRRRGRLKLSISRLRGRSNARILRATTHGRIVHYSARYGNTVAICVHALDIAHVITLLGDISRGAPRARPNQTSPQQAATRANCGTCSASNRRSRRGAQPGSYGRACHAARRRSLVRRGTAGLLNRELPALVIISAKLIETFSGARQDHYAGTRRHACA